jgi:hypothetical protein
MLNSFAQWVGWSAPPAPTPTAGAATSECVVEAMPRSAATQAPVLAEAAPRLLVESLDRPEATLVPTARDAAPVAGSAVSPDSPVHVVCSPSLPARLAALGAGTAGGAGRAETEAQGPGAEDQGVAAAPVSEAELAQPRLVREAIPRSLSAVSLALPAEPVTHAMRDGPMGVDRQGAPLSLDAARLAAVRRLEPVSRSPLEEWCTRHAVSQQFQVPFFDARKARSGHLADGGETGKIPAAKESPQQAGRVDELLAGLAKLDGRLENLLSKIDATLAAPSSGTGGGLVCLAPAGSVGQQPTRKDAAAQTDELAESPLRAPPDRMSGLAARPACSFGTGPAEDRAGLHGLVARVNREVSEFYDRAQCLDGRGSRMLEGELASLKRLVVAKLRACEAKDKWQRLESSARSWVLLIRGAQALERLSAEHAELRKKHDGLLATLHAGLSSQRAAQARCAVLEAALSRPQQRPERETRPPAACGARRETGATSATGPNGRAAKEHTEHKEVDGALGAAEVRERVGGLEAARVRLDEMKRALAHKDLLFDHLKTKYTSHRDKWRRQHEQQQLEVGQLSDSVGHLSKQVVRAEKRQTRRARKKQLRGAAKAGRHDLREDLDLAQEALADDGPGRKPEPLPLKLLFEPLPPEEEEPSGARVPDMPCATNPFD